LHLMTGFLHENKSQQAPKYPIKETYTLRPTLYRLRMDLRIVDILAAVQWHLMSKESCRSPKMLASLRPIRY
jgi:hypothetical protein